MNKAVFADFFAAEREAGFALVIFSSGAASAASFFMMYCGWVCIPLLGNVELSYQLSTQRTCRYDCLFLSAAKRGCVDWFGAEYVRTSGLRNSDFAEPTKWIRVCSVRAMIAAFTNMGNPGVTMSFLGMVRLPGLLYIYYYPIAQYLT